LYFSRVIFRVICPVMLQGKRIYAVAAMDG